MRKLIYHVATSIDGFIAQENDNINLFPTEGDHIPDYIQSLASYDTCIMGRRTYEFGYRYGMQPGDNPYPHMETYVYSTTLDIKEKDSNLHFIADDCVQHIRKLKEVTGKPVYLCGGGILASVLIKHGLLDELHIKHNPIIVGRGVPLFAHVTKGLKLNRLSLKEYSNGVNLIIYEVDKSYLTQEA